MTAAKKAEIQGRMFGLRNMLLEQSLTAAAVVELVLDVEYLLEEVQEQAESLDDAMTTIAVMRSPVRRG